MKKLPRMYLSIRNCKQLIPIGEPKEIISYILQSIPNLELWSYESLKTLHTDLYQILIEYCTQERETKIGSEKAKYTRVARSAEKALRHTPRDHLSLLIRMYDILLTGEGLGRLHGYGMTNRWGDHIKGDPEYNRMTKKQI
jgi:hypothetical protein